MFDGVGYYESTKVELENRFISFAKEAYNLENILQYEDDFRFGTLFPNNSRIADFWKVAYDFINFVYETNSTLEDKGFQERNRLLPIPLYVMDINVNMHQNAGC